jgi:sugar/nucleoside kinase (ribokinase family)
MPEAPLILCAGIAVLDEIFRVARFPGPQAKTKADQFASVPGGCVTNAAIAIARLGGRPRLVAPLGGSEDDLVAARILEALTREGVDCSRVVRIPGVRSPISAVLIDPAGERIIINYRDEKLAMSSAGDPTALLEGADAVLVDNRFPEFVLPIAEAARRKNLPVVLDGDKPTEQAHALLTIATHVVFSAEGLRTTIGIDNLGDALRQMAANTPAFLAVTDGRNDILWLEGGKLRRVSTFSVETVDSLGAGDVFHGAFVLALAEKRREGEALRIAAAAAALKCARFGGGLGAPTRREVEALLTTTADGSGTAAV